MTILGSLAESYRRGGKFSRDVRRYFIDMGIEGGTEALQEGFQQVMGNLIAKGQYRPEQDVFEGAGRAALVGGTVGTIASGVIGGFGLSQARQAEAGTQTPVQAEATTEPQGNEQAQPEDPFGITDDRTEIPTQKGFANPEQKDSPSSFIVKDEEMDRPDVLGGPDVIDYIRELGGIIPKGRAETERNLRLYGKKGGPSINRLQGAGAIPEYDGATGINAGYRKEISGTIAPDEMAQMLLDNYAIGDGSVDGLWSSVSKAIETRNKNKRSMQDFRKVGRQEKAFIGNILKPKNQSKESVTADQFYKGDKFVAGGEDFRVSDISPDTGAVTVIDGDKYGTQTLRLS